MLLASHPTVRMNVLVLTQVLPYPPDSGPAVKTWNVLKHLTSTHDVTLASFVRGDQSAAIRHLEQYCRAVHTVPMRRSRWRDVSALVHSWSSATPFVIARDDRAVMHALVQRLVRTENFDVVHVDQINMAPYAMALDRSRRILDAHNALWLALQRLAETRPSGFARRLLERESSLMRHYEGAICRQFDAVLAVSDMDRRALETAADGAVHHAHVIPIAIDTREIVPVAREAGGDHVLHLGTLLWPPNADGARWFLREVLPLVRRARPDVTVDIIGTRPPRALRADAARETGVRVLGFAPDLTDALRRASVLVVPLRAGAGMRVRILNGLAQQMPIVTTTVGCEGIDVVHGRHLLIAESAAEFAAATVRLLSRPDEAAQLGRNGRGLIEARYDVRHMHAALDEVYHAMGDRRP